MPTFSDRNTKMLDGKCVAITGCNAGIGKVTAIELAKRGAKILMLCRNEEKTQPIMDEIKQESANENISFYKLDLSSLKSVQECAKTMKEREEKIDILINNAGVMACPKATTEDGYDMQLQTNHLGHFLLTELLMPLIKTSAAGGFHPRIIILSSSAHELGRMNWDDINYEKSYDATRVYCQSKLANVLHAKELARRLDGTGISVYAVHPGVVNTELQRHSDQTWSLLGIFTRLFKCCFKTPNQGAQTTLYCVLEDSIEDDSGMYYVDCKQKRPHRRAEVEEDQKRLWSLSEKMVGINNE